MVGEGALGRELRRLLRANLDFGRYGVSGVICEDVDGKIYACPDRSAANLLDARAAFRRKYGYKGSAYVDPDTCRLVMP